MNDNIKDDTAFDRVRRALALGLVSSPPIDGPSLCLPVPGGYGLVAFTGSLDAPMDAWTVRDTDVTVAEMRAVAARLAAEGLGTLANLGWNRPGSFMAEATAWGATPAQAVDQLVAGLGALWPQVAAAVADPVLEDAWTDEQVRIVGTGVAITAPASRSSRAWPALTARGADVELSVAPAEVMGWVTTLRSAGLRDPRPWATAFSASRAADGGADGHAWRSTDADVQLVGFVVPIVRATGANVA